MQRLDTHARTAPRILLAAALALGAAACGGDDDDAPGPLPDQAMIDQRAAWAKTAKEPFLTDHSNELLATGTEGSGVLSLNRLYTTLRDTVAWGKAAIEIVAVNHDTGKVFSVNSQMEYVSYATLAADGSMTGLTALQVRNDVPEMDGINSIAIADNTLAVALEVLDDSPVPVQIAGRCAFYDVSGETPVFIRAVEVGALPDAVTAAKDGSMFLFADEGEPPLMDSGENFDYTNDPEAGITIISRPAGGWADVSQDDVTTLDFRDFNDGGSRASERPKEIHRLAPEDPNGPPGKAVSTWAQQFEPEYIAISPDNDEAWAVLQEQNTVAVIDLVNTRIDRLIYLGEKDGLLPGNEFDASSLDDVRLANWPVWLMYQPDTIRSYKAADGEVYYVTANEGDPRSEDWTWDEAEKIGALDLDPRYFPGKDEWQANDMLGSLMVTTTRGDANHDGLYENLYAFGGRSFSIWAQDGTLVFDSNNWFEIVTANLYGTDFNNDSKKYRPQYDSDWKGPEPEPLVLGAIEVGGEERTFAFVGSEKIGGLWVYDITDPTAAEYVCYFNLRDFTYQDPRNDLGADLATEGMEFIPAAESSTGKPLLFLGNETSGTNSVYEITVNE